MTRIVDFYTKGSSTLKYFLQFLWPNLTTSSIFCPSIAHSMLLVTRFPLETQKFIDQRIKGVKVYICNIIKNTK